MNIGILGHFARNTNMCDGQTVKTRNVEQALMLRTEKIKTVDSCGWRKHPVSFLFDIIRLVKQSDVIIMLPDAGGIKVYPYVINLFSSRKKIKIYSVIGAWLPSYLKKCKRMRKQLKKFDHILVETQTMKKQLNEQGLNNVAIVPNFKDITPIKEEEINYDFSYPLEFCIFSRVTKDKGVSDAIYACERLNSEKGEIVCTLDVYGPLYDDYRAEFSELCEKYSSFVKYKGMADPSQSVEVLRKYYMLLFPTLLYYVEGIPGTIIDAFSAGLPVLASEWESCRDVLSEQDSISFKLGDTEALYEKLKYCVENIEAVNAYRKECLQSAEKFSLNMATDKIWGFINGAVEKQQEKE